MLSLRLVLLLLPLCAAVDLHAAAHPGGEPVLTTGLRDYRQAGPARARVDIVTATGHPEYFSTDLSFTEGARVRVDGAGEQPWSTQWGTRFCRKVAAGDTLLLRFSFRALESADETGQVFIHAVAQQSARPWAKSLLLQVAAGEDWKEIEMPFEMDGNYGAGDASLIFWFGGVGPQAVLLGGVELLNYGTTVSAGDLPATGLDYAGREPDAPWRAEALARIEKLRKGGLIVRVVDEASNPVAGAAVRAEMRKHAFLFGTAVSARRLIADHPDRETYRRVLLDNFNAATIENALKWAAYAAEWGQEKYDFETITSPARNPYPHPPTFRPLRPAHPRHRVRHQRDRPGLPGRLPSRFLHRPLQLAVRSGDHPVGLLGERTLVRRSRPLGPELDPTPPRPRLPRPRLQPVVE